MKVLQRFRASTTTTTSSSSNSSPSSNKKGGGGGGGTTTTTTTTTTRSKEETTSSRRHSIILERGSTFHSDEGTVTSLCTSTTGGDVMEKRNNNNNNNNDNHDHDYDCNEYSGENNNIVNAVWEGKRKWKRRASTSTCGGSVTMTTTTTTTTGGRMPLLLRSHSFRCKVPGTGGGKGKTKSTRRASVIGGTSTTSSSSSSSSVIDDTIRAVPKNTANERIVRRFVERLNDRDLDGCIGLISENCEWRFSGMEHITIKNFGDMIRSIVRSFPDFAFDGGDGDCDGTTTAAAVAVQVGPGVVQMRNMILSGTHTGESFGLRHCSPLPATGWRCTNDPENVTFFLRDGKIAQVQSVASRPDGRLYGPMGMYQQIKEGRVTK